MALGIKKITESVVEDERALIMIGSYSSSDDVIEFDDNNAVPEGALISSLTSRTIRVKTSLDGQARIDGDSSLGLESITNKLLASFSVTSDKIANGAVITEKIANDAVTQSKLANNSVTTIKIADEAVVFPKLDKETQTRINNLESNLSLLTSRVTVLEANINELKGTVNELRNKLNEEVNKLENKINNIETNINAKIEEITNNFNKKFESIEVNVNKIVNIINQNKLENAVIHNGSKSVGSKYAGSTSLVNLQCTGDIEGKRVYFMTYQDLAEAYIPGEELDAGEIVAMHEDGKVYRAESMNDCIVGVISDQFANCFGATKEELFNGTKVAVGMIGKVLVKVKGPIKIGQQVAVSLSDLGVGYASNSRGIGQALHSVDCDFDEINEVLVQIRPM